MFWSTLKFGNAKQTRTREKVKGKQKKASFHVLFLSQSLHLSFKAAPAPLSPHPQLLFFMLSYLFSRSHGESGDEEEGEHDGLHFAKENVNVSER